MQSGRRILLLNGVAAIAMLTACEGPPEEVDTVSGASAPPATELRDGRLEFESAGMQLFLEELAATGNVIWAFDFIDDQTMIFTERRGQARLLNLTSGEITDLDGEPEVMVTDSGGLFDVLVDPDFAANGYVYFTFVKGLGEQSAVALVRSRFAASELVDTIELFVANNPHSDHAHWGSRVVMDADRYLFMTSGDRHVPDNAQDLSSHGGKVLRLHADGAVPADNPFTETADAAPEIWSLGHRNPQGLVIQPDTGALFAQEHGPTGGDEINIIRKGRNYGWPLATHGTNIWGGQQPRGTTLPGFEAPAKFWVPGTAPTGLAFYTGDRMPGWRGNLFSVTLRGPLIRNVVEGSEIRDESRYLTDWIERARDIAQGPDGLLYFATESGKIFRIGPVE